MAATHTPAHARTHIFPLLHLPPGRQIFHEALADGSMVGFFKLMEQFK